MIDFSADRENERILDDYWEKLDMSREEFNRSEVSWLLNHLSDVESRLSFARDIIKESIATK